MEDLDAFFQEIQAARDAPESSGVTEPLSPADSEGSVAGTAILTPRAESEVDSVATTVRLGSPEGELPVQSSPSPTSFWRVPAPESLDGLLSQPDDLEMRDEIAEARAFALGLCEIWRAGARRAEASEAEPEPEADPTEMLVEDCASEAGEMAAEPEYALVLYEGAVPAETARAAEVVEIHDSESKPEEEPEEYEPGLALRLHLFNLVFHPF